MKMESWIRGFWRKVYGRQPRETKATELLPANPRIVVLDDMGDFVVLIVTETPNGVRQVWREVKP